MNHSKYLLSYVPVTQVKVEKNVRPTEIAIIPRNAMKYLNV